MKIIKSGTTYRIYDESLVVLDSLPALTYNVCFSEFEGFSLEKHSSIEAREEKIYGVHEKKVEKVLRRFNNSSKNLGVILSGDKGIGKSLFARLLSQKAMDMGYPVIIVKEYIAGIEDFLDSIEQEVIVLFDEFDKTFAKKNDSFNPQDRMLSLFDGISSGKKLFIITCNEYNYLSDYLINRPGRFHYHFRFEYPSSTEIDEYLKDKLDEKYYSEIPKVISFARKINLNYDCLSAIVLELNNGEKFEEAIQDLNIIKEKNNTYYNLKLFTQEGYIFSLDDRQIDLFSNSKNFFWLNDEKGFNIVGVEFSPSDAIYDEHKEAYEIPAEKFKIEYDDDYHEEEIKEYKKLHYSHLEIKIAPQRQIHYMI